MIDGSDPSWVMGLDQQFNHNYDTRSVGRLGHISPGKTGATARVSAKTPSRFCENAGSPLYSWSPTTCVLCVSSIDIVDHPFCFYLGLSQHHNHVFLGEFDLWGRSEWTHHDEIDRERCCQMWRNGFLRFLWNARVEIENGRFACGLYRDSSWKSNP